MADDALRHIRYGRQHAQPHVHLVSLQRPARGRLRRSRTSLPDLHRPRPRRTRRMDGVRICRESSGRYHRHPDGLLHRPPEDALRPQTPRYRDRIRTDGHRISALPRHPRERGVDAQYRVLRHHPVRLLFLLHADDGHLLRHLHRDRRTSGGAFVHLERQVGMRHPLFHPGLRRRQGDAQQH